MRGDVLVLQLRSMIRFGRKKQFVKEISDFVKNNQIKDVVLLTSLPYALKQDLEITSSYLIVLSLARKTFITNKKETFPQTLPSKNASNLAYCVSSTS